MGEDKIKIKQTNNQPTNQPTNKPMKQINIQPTNKQTILSCIYTSDLSPAVFVLK